MCSQYTVKISKHDLLTTLRVTEDWASLDEVPQKVLPYTKAPVVFVDDSARQLDLMQFSLIPKWSAEPRSKFSTHNARLDTIDEKNTFKDAFVKHHCIVPMTGFIEPIYGGNLAGNMVEFHPPVPVLLYAAGIWDEWVNKKTGEVLKSFSVITHDPIPFVFRTGHDRSPVFLKPSDADTWLQSAGNNSKDLKAFLFEKRLEPDLATDIERPLKPGWEKRIAKK